LVSPKTNTKLLLQQQRGEGNIDTRNVRIRTLGSKILHVRLCSVLSGCLDLLCLECIYLKCKNKQPHAVVYPNRHGNHAQY